MIVKLHGIPFLLLIAIILSGLIIFIVFGIIDKYFITLSSRNQTYSKIDSFLPKLELFIWFIWFVLSLYFLLLSSPTITIIFLVGIYLFSKDFWKNIYSGIFLMFDKKIREGDYIEIPELNCKGIIKRLLLSDIELIKDDEELIYVPYSLIVSTPILKRENIRHHYLNEFYIDFDKRTNKLSENIIKEVIINCPWTVLTKTFEVDPNNEKGFYIKAYTLNKETATLQQNFIERELKNLIDSD